jgi:hypothetical protein
VLTMRVRGTIELRNFVLSLGPWVKVLKPIALRSEISGLAGEMAALYNGHGRYALSGLSEARPTPSGLKASRKKGLTKRDRCD